MSKTLPPKDNVATVLLGPKRKRAVLITKDILINQIFRDGPAIAKSFDRLNEAHIREISEVLADSMSVIFPHMLVESEDYKPTCSRLLGSAITAFMASLEVARHGFRRPYGAMARHLIETLATVLHIIVEPDALKQFNAGRLQSTKSITVASKVLPDFGRQYGMLSDRFVHITKSHAGFDPIVAYEKDDAALGFIVLSLKSNAWLIYVVAELAFYDDISSPRYWKNVGHGAFVYDPSDDQRRLLKRFFDERIAEL